MVDPKDMTVGSRIVGDVDAAFTDSGYVLGRVFQSSDGYWYRMISQSASHAEGTILQYVPGTAGGYACETGYANAVQCAPAGVVVVGKTAAGIQPVLIHGRASVILCTLATSSAASVAYTYNSAGQACVYATTNYPPIIVAYASQASTNSTMASGGWVNIWK